MSALLTNKSRFFNTENFISAVKSGDKMLYVFMAKDDKWIDEPSPVEGTDFVTPTPINSDYRERIDSEDILCMKRVLYQDIVRITRYVVWDATKQTEYDMYDDSIDLFGKNFFVVNGLNVYKCIVRGDDKSTVPPTTVSTTLLQKNIEDGYQWKYMYSLGSETSSGIQWNWTDEIINVINPASADWMPVKYITTREENPTQWEVIKNAIDGAIYYIEVLSGPSVPDGNVTLYKPDGTTEYPNFVATCSTNKIDITNPGEDIHRIGKITITDSSNNTTDVTDRLRPIYSPPGGHGRDPVKELMGCYVYIETGMPENIIWTNDDGEDGHYRKVGLIYDPLRVRRTDGNDNTYNTVSAENELVLGEKINKSVPEEKLNDYLVYSGDIIYVDNLDNLTNNLDINVPFPRTKTSSQIIDIKMILTF